MYTIKILSHILVYNYTNDLIYSHNQITLVDNTTFNTLHNYVQLPNKQSLFSMSTPIVFSPSLNIYSCTLTPRIDFSLFKYRGFYHVIFAANFTLFNILFSGVNRYSILRLYHLSEIDKFLRWNVKVWYMRVISVNKNKLEY